MLRLCTGVMKAESPTVEPLNCFLRLCEYILIAQGGGESLPIENYFGGRDVLSKLFQHLLFLLQIPVTAGEKGLHINVSHFCVVYPLCSQACKERPQRVNMKLLIRAGASI